MKTRPGKSCDYRNAIAFERSVFKFPSTQNWRKVDFSNSSSPLLFEECFRKARISGRISVDSRPNRRNKTVFFNFLRRNVDATELNATILTRLKETKQRFCLHLYIPIKDP